MPKLFFSYPKGVTYYLDAAFSFLPDGAELKYGYDLSCSPCPRYLKGWGTPYRIKNDLVKVNGKVYMRAHGPQGLLGTGSYGEVHLAKALHGEDALAIKEESLAVSKTELEDKLHEAQILSDLHLGLGAANLPDGKKRFTIMQYLGKPLEKHLRDESLSSDMRLNLAIDMCWQVYRLHSGLQSKSGTAYVHRDIKPSNFTIDDSGHIHLIDFGLARKYPNKKSLDAVGSPGYMPGLGRFSGYKPALINRQFDMLALKRTLYFPNQLLCGLGLNVDKRKHHHHMPMVLSAKILRDKGLARFISTATNERTREDKADDKLTVLSLMAILILARYDIGSSYYRLAKNNQELSAAVIGSYFENKDNSSKILMKKHIQELIKPYTIKRAIVYKHRLILPKTKQQKLALLVLSGIDKNLTEAIENEPLMAALSRNKSTQVRQALAALFHFNLATESNVNFIKDHVELASWVRQLYLDNQRQSMVNLLASHVSHLAFEKLRRIKKEDAFGQVVVSQQALNLVAQSPHPSATRAILDVMKYKPLSTDRLNALIENDLFSQEPYKFNTDVINAITFLRKNNWSTLLPITLFSDNYRVITILNSFIKDRESPTLVDRVLKKLDRFMLDDGYVNALTRADNHQECACVFLLFIKGIDIKSSVYLFLEDKQRLGDLFELLTHKAYENSTIEKIINHHELYEEFLQMRSHHLPAHQINKLIGAIENKTIYKKEKAPTKSHSHIKLPPLSLPTTNTGPRFFSKPKVERRLRRVAPIVAYPWPAKP